MIGQDFDWGFTKEELARTHIGEVEKLAKEKQPTDVERHTYPLYVMGQRLPIMVPGKRLDEQQEPTTAQVALAAMQQQHLGGTFRDMVQRSILTLGDKVTIRQVELGPGEFVRTLPGVYFPTEAKISKCLGQPVILGEDPNELGVEWIHHPRYEVKINCEVTRYGRKFPQERFFNVIFEDIILKDITQFTTLDNQPLNIEYDFFNPMEQLTEE